jgi:Protein of unknown function (DUF1566)
MKKYILIFFAIAQILNAVELQRNQIESEVIDSEHGLVWQDKKNSATEKQSYKTALGYCHSLSLKSKLDWRLPSANEFATVIDTSRTPSIDSTFRYCANDGYWILNDTGHSNEVEWIDFNDGVKYIGSGFEKRMYVRCVRSNK